MDQLGLDPLVESGHRLSPYARDAVTVPPSAAARADTRLAVLLLLYRRATDTLDILLTPLRDNSVPMLRSTERFSSRVENYSKYRPGYPAAVLELLRAPSSVGASTPAAGWRSSQTSDRPG